MERIRRQLARRFGKGTQYTIGGIGSGLMYGNDECLDMQGRLYQYFSQDGSNTLYKCYYTIPEGETDWSNIDYTDPDETEVGIDWRYAPHWVKKDFLLPAVDGNAFDEEEMKLFEDGDYDAILKQYEDNPEFVLVYQYGKIVEAPL